MEKKNKIGPPYAEFNSIYRDIFNIVKGEIQVINTIGLGYMPKKCANSAFTNRITNNYL